MLHGFEKTEISVVSRAQNSDRELPIDWIQRNLLQNAAAAQMTTSSLLATRARHGRMNSVELLYSFGGVSSLCV